MKIPHANLSQVALREVVEEFVTRDGTDHSEVDQRVIDILLQLENGIVELHFDQETNTCNIVYSAKLNAPREWNKSGLERVLPRSYRKFLMGWHPEPSDNRRAESLSNAVFVND